MAQYQPPETSSSSRQSKQAPGSSRISERAEKTAQRLEDNAIEKVQEARAQVEERRNQIGERIKRFGDVLRKTGQEVSGQDQPVAKYIDMASDRIERVASYVSSANIKSLARDAEDIAARRPFAFYGSSLLLGMVAGRLLKGASGSGEQHSTQGIMREASSESMTSVVSTRTESIGSESAISPTGGRMP
jgi:hypothetical protein